MAVSVFDLFKIGIGPSSSHTVGPMRAAKMFAESLQKNEWLAQTNRVRAQMYGSLGLTGVGHGTDKGVLLGLLGYSPDTVPIETVQDELDKIALDQRIFLLGTHEVGFSLKHDLILHRRQALAEHPNGMKFTAYDADDNAIVERKYLSVGGGFVVTVGMDPAPVLEAYNEVKYPFASAKELLAICERERLTIAQVMLANEQTWRSEAEVREELIKIWRVMQTCVARGCGIDNPDATGYLPGGLNVKRRAAELYTQLTKHAERALADPLSVMDWVNLYAIAVNEENAAGGRVVTAPTNGAAGVIPAVLHYYERFTPNARPNDNEGIITFLLTAGAVGILYKLNASISGAEVGCQGEVGVACSMAAAGLAAAQGGNTAQIENAAEIGMEHNLGLTCDPVGGLVQIPCIERNAMGAIKAVNAARMALRGDGAHHVSLDMVIKTMRDTGADMKSKYKETAKGGLAVNMVEC
ncbi:L-serine ammonia-lyase [Hydromonas duriensis]|uniref:L-serine dehydratase n=1 Tax=Hydromonas duriensis TaxID=1527608 RepID=A0A4V3DJR5_9BURK|nr:L-serine ammonia-lyase [Hydromonas duriensis]TDR31140.1 L-serine ammonia-lyase [Hydromonas duriensis]